MGPEPIIRIFFMSVRFGIGEGLGSIFSLLV